MAKSNLSYLTNPIVDDNPVTLQMLGICSALAVTTSLSTALTMSIALIGVLTASSGTISLIRNHIPTSIRLVIQITIIASLVIVADQFLKAFAYEMSLRLSVFVGLIVTNCLVLARAESFAMHNRVIPSLFDALGNGLGYSLILLLVATVRELLGAGSLFGMPVLPLTSDGGWFEPLRFMLLAPSAFFIIGLLIWAIRSRRHNQVEVNEFQLILPDQDKAHD